MATCPTCRTRYPDDVKTCAQDGEALLPDEQIAELDGDLPAGQTVGEYRVEGKLGEGGFGAVYRAVHPLIGKTAAIKVLNKQYSANPQMVSRFIAEARAVNQIRNRNIIDIFSFGALEDGRQYYVMELLDGMTLDSYVKQKRRLSVEEAVPILRGIARALDAAHAAGIAHRDLKPENIFLVIEDDGTVFPKLLDFGIAKLLGDSIAGHKTRTGTPMGTPHYMSPEQCRGRNVDHRTDLYSFGVLVFEALTGKVPFDGEDVMEILIQHTSAPAPKPSSVNPQLPPGLDAPLLAFMEKDPDKRPASVGAGLEALAQAAVDAGLDVKLSQKRVTGDPSRSGPQAAVGNATPAEMKSLADARTQLPDAGAKTILSAEAADKPAGSKAMVYVVAAVVAIGAAAAVLITLRPKEPANAGTPNLPTYAVSASASAAPVTPKAPEPPPTVTPSAAPAALPAEVEITFEITPKTAEIWQGTTKLGTAAAPIKMKRGDEKVKLTIKARGYLPHEVEVTPAESRAVPVTLKKAGGGASSKNKDLEF